MLKFLTFLIIVLFAWWRIRRWFMARRRRALGLPPEASPRVRPITVLSLILLIVYGGFLLWHALSRFLPAA